MRSSRGVSEARTSEIVSRRFDWIAASIGWITSIRELLGYPKERRNLSKRKLLFLTIFNLICDMTAIMRLIDSIDTCRLTWELVSLA
jgi:hypothetical protein